MHEVVLVRFVESFSFIVARGRHIPRHKKHVYGFTDTHYNCARSSTLQRTSKCVLTSTIKKPKRNVKRLHPSCKYVDDQRAIKSLRVRPRAREATRATASQILGIDSSCFTSTCMSRSIAFSPFSLTSCRTNSTHSVREMMPSPLRARGQSAGSEHSEGDEGGSNNQSA